MIRAKITYPDGTVQFAVVEQVTFILTCGYSRCREPFETDNIERKYCRPSHAVRASEDRNLGVRPALQFAISPKS